VFVCALLEASMLVMICGWSWAVVRQVLVCSWR
jgi:hypothetical protein